MLLTNFLFLFCLCIEKHCRFLFALPCGFFFNFSQLFLLTFSQPTFPNTKRAYCLPLLQQLKTTEVFGGEGEAYEARKPKRPRLLIIAPTRELVVQIKDVVKSLCHSIKLSSRALIGGQDYGKQRKALERPVDVVVSTPGRLLQHWKEGHIFFGDVQYIVLDEMDTLLEQGFQKELQQILYPLLWTKPLDEENPQLKDGAPKIVLTSATMTKSIQKIVSRGDESKRNNDDNTITAQRHYTKPGSDKAKVILPKVNIIKAPGLHKAVPRLEQVFVDVGNIDKISLLVDVVSADSAKRGNEKKGGGNHLTMVFCNTAASCRAAQFALSEARIESLSYHGELNSIARSENLRRFRQAGEDPDSSEPRVLVCTDLGARGLDVPQVNLLSIEQHENLF
jgi:superfamily II DNA/RNA helicase